MSTAWSLAAKRADQHRPLPPPWDGDIDVRDEKRYAAVGSLINTDADLALAVCCEAFAQGEARKDVDAAAAALLCMYRVLQNTSSNLELRSELWAMLTERAGAVVDPVVAVRMALVRMVRLVDCGEHAQVLVEGHSALAKAMAIGSEPLVSAVINPLTLALRGIVEPDLALALLQHMAPLPPGDEPLVAGVHANRANNSAMLWLDRAAMHDAVGDSTAARIALGNAGKQAERACSLTLPLNNDRMKVLHLDTLIQVLLRRGEATAARAQLHRLQSALAAPPKSGTEVWGHLQLAMTRVDMHEKRDPQEVLLKLQAVECVPGSDFQLGNTHRVVQTALAQVHERLGQYAQALACHKRVTDWQSEAHTATSRERVKMMRHTLVAMRTEAAEFITHDLRTPLTAARTWLQTVALEPLSTSSQNALHEAKHQLRQAFDLSDLYLSVLRAEFLPASALQRLDLGALTDDLCESLSPPMASRTVLTRDVEIGVDVLGHARLLKSSLAALLNQAFARAPANTAVHVRLARVRDSAQLGPVDQVQLSVAAQGESLPLQARMRLYQCHAPGAAEGVSPFGLVARVARLHRAQILIDSPTTGGSTVMLRFKPA
jgi:signal transduction histidine kinase